MIERIHKFFGSSGLIAGLLACLSLVFACFFCWSIDRVNQAHQRSWEQFARDNNCQVVLRDTTSGFFGPGPSETWRCADGREFKRPLKP